MIASITRDRQGGGKNSIDRIEQEIARSIVIAHLLTANEGGANA